jgi:hypothetical protein
MNIKEWFKHHFALGLMISGTLCSILAWMILEWKLPWFLTTVKSPFHAFWMWLGTEVAVYRWWYWVLILYFVITIIAIAVLIFQSHIPDWKQYRADTFFDIVWRWDFDGRDGFSYHITPFCPRCDRGLELGKQEDSMRAGYDVPDTLSCRHHGVIHTFAGPYDRLERIIKDEVLRKLRNGEWKTVVEQTARSS